MTTPIRALGTRNDEGVVHLRDSGVRYSDGIEDHVHEILADEQDLRSVATTLAARASGRAEAFQLDPARGNIVRGLRLPPGARVLEIGAGMGAVTRLLGERAALVDAVEPVAARARVARERTRDLPGVEVFVGSHEDVPAEPTYDAVVVVGVLEYVGEGAADPAPYVAFLERLAAVLVPGGTLALAIENKLGVKYVVGAPEDHTDVVFDSVEDYPAGAPVRTFSRAELEDLVRAAGLEPTVHVAFPDYKVTRAVMDVPALYRHAPRLLADLPNFPSPDLRSRRPHLADEGRVWHSLVDAGLAADFGNSFLVLAGKGGPQRLWPDDQLAVYYSRGRTEPFAFEKRVLLGDSGVRIERRAVGADAPPDAPIRPTDGDEAYVDGPTLVEAALQGTPEDAVRLLHRWHAALLSKADAARDGAPFDFTPNNIVLDKDGELVAIDQEWTAPGWSVDRIVRRGVLWFAAMLVHGTVPARWAGAGTLRDVVRDLGRAVDLPAGGSWVDTAVAEEAEFLASVLIPGPGESVDDARRRIEDELSSMLDDELKELPLGRRLPEKFDELAAHLVKLDDEIDELRGLVAERDALIGALRVPEAELAALKASRTWRVVRGVSGVTGRVLPPGTRRRNAAALSARQAARVVRTLRPRPVEQPASVPEAPTSLPTSTDPKVSVVIPVYGHWDATADCLRSFAEHPPTVPYELVVVDDASPDDSRRRLEAIEGVRVVALENNRGFIGAVNAGLEASRGEYVALLNNDTEITDGWLEALLDAFDEPDVGLVGSKLVYPDGRLQEAGGIIFDNAGGWNYGRGDDPAKDRYNYRRDVDYCSAAAVLLRRDLFTEIGGLSEEYAPAYYDDTDLAFRIRARGLRVVYEPAAVVVHHEGVSHGTDTSSGLKAHQEINKVRFERNWRDALAQHYPQDAALVEAAARRHDGKGTVVVIDDHIPRPDEDSGSVRLVGMLEALRRLGWHVVYVPHNRGTDPVWGPRLLAAGIEVFTGPEPLEHFLRSIADRVKVVIGARVTVAWPYLGLVRRVVPGARFIFDTVDLHHVREQREADLADDEALRRRAAETRGLEIGMVMASDMTFVVSPTEVDVLALEAPGAPVRVVPNVHVMHPRVRGAAERSGMVFVGSYAHPPNCDAVDWLLRDIFPRVRERCPEATLTIVGKGLPEEIAALAGPGVTLAGWLPSLDELYATCRLSLAPLRYGAGIKGKVGEALSHGVPVVGTSIACEGMGIEDGVTGWIADDAEAFADAVVQALGDDEAWERISVQGQAHIEQTLGIPPFERALRDALSALVPEAGSR